MIPKLRIQSFSGDWIEVKIGDVYQNLKTGNTPSRRVKDFFNGNIPWVTSGELNRGEIFETVEKITPEAVSTTNLKLYPIGTFFMAITGLEAPGTRGKCGIIQIPATTNQSCLAFEESNKISNRFLFHWYLHNSERLYQRFAQGTKQESYNNKIVSSFRICIPSRKEQNEITHLLDLLDQKINLLTKKKKVLETYKEGLMQKIFSQELWFKREDGTDYPEWDYQPLGDLAYITSGKSNREDSDTEAKYHFFDRSSDVRRSGIYLYDDDAVIVAGEGQEFIPKKFSGKFDLHQRAYAIMKFGERLSYEYCYYFIFHHRRYFERMAVGTTVLSLRLPMFQKMMIQLPSMEEQDKIVAVFTNIDSYLKNVSNGIQSTESLKKGLLQQMFV